MCNIKKGFDVIERAEDGVVFFFNKPPHFKLPQQTAFGEKKKYSLPDLAKSIRVLNLNGESVEIKSKTVSIKNKDVAKAFFELCKKGGVNPTTRQNNDQKRKTTGGRIKK